MVPRLIPALVVVAGSLLAASPEEYFRAIRADDATSLGSLIKAGGVNDADKRATTPLHYAAAFGSTDAVRLLLAGGANVNARNTMGATPLVLAAASPEKVRLLLAKGADANAKTNAGRTALIIAAGLAGGYDTARQLIAAGGQIDAADERGIRPLTAAAYSGDLATVKLLLDKGAAADTPDKSGVTPLMGAVTTNEIERVRLLLAKGANVNAANVFAGKVKNGNIALVKMTPLHYAAPKSSVQIIEALLKAGANPNVQDGRGMTPLMAAVTSEDQNRNVMQALIAAGADVNAKDPNGETVLDWARKFNYPGTIAMLESAGAKGAQAPVGPRRQAEPAEMVRAVELARDLMQKSNARFFQEGGCAACHHQSIGARAEQLLAKNGMASTQDPKKVHLAAMAAMAPTEPYAMQYFDMGGETDTVASVLNGFAAAGIPSNSLTDAGVRYVAGRQRANGAWIMGGISRAPFEESNITRTAGAVRALRAYAWPAIQHEVDERIARARAWLLKAEPRTSYERADLLLGLYWAGASTADLERVASGLLKQQRPDGGWSQNPYLQSDAYATGLALYALHESGRARVSDAAYQKGTAFLLRTQLEDGSWYVRSRAPKFQPYFQSGFPHDHDQWISSTATAYALMALAPAAGESVKARQNISFNAN